MSAIGEIIGIFGAILVSFLLGAFALGFFGGKTTINYLKVKMSKNKKLLIWADTPTGRRSLVGKLEGELKEGTISWNYLGSVKITEITKDNVGRFFSVNYVALNVDTPEVCYNLTELGEKPRTSIDNKTFSQILVRAETKPQIEDDVQGKLIKIVLVGLLIVIVLCAVLVFKVITIEQVVNNLGVVA